MESVRSRLTRPAPWQFGQGSSTISPRPWQFGQVRSMAKNPCAARTRPKPPQVEQGRGLEPGLAPEPEQVSQVIEVGILMVSAFPVKASSREISRL